MPPSHNESSPFSFAPSEAWDGDAGSWSSFIIRVGTPPQDFRVLPSTSGQQTWIPVPEGCNQSYQTNPLPSNCGALRGAMPFQGSQSNGFVSNASSTWVSKGIYQLDVETYLGYTGNGDFGFDTVGLEVENSGGLTLTNQLVAGIATEDFFLGQFGLGPKPINLSTFEHPIPSYMQNLADQNLIPSLSFGFTAGAKYRLYQVLGSLTLGGYDASRFTPNNLTFPLDADDSQSLTLSLQSITVSNTLQGALTPLSQGALFMIDSSVPDIWLPMSACQLFEQAFGLIYDPLTDLYLVNDSIHEQLQQKEPTVTFKLGIMESEGPSVDITLPYGAFDLQASSPIYPNATNYFPLRRAANETQQTLGRAFLQEVYIIADYERSNFSVYQAVFKEPNPSQIVTIHSTSYTAANGSTTPGGHQRLDHGGIVGLAIGVVAFLATILTIVTLMYRRKGAHPQTPSASPVTQVEVVTAGVNDEPDTPGNQWCTELEHVVHGPQELSGDSMHKVELQGCLAISEMDNNMRDEVQEVASQAEPRELDGGALVSGVQRLGKYP